MYIDQLRIKGHLRYAHIMINVSFHTLGGSSGKNIVFEKKTVS